MIRDHGGDLDRAIARFGGQSQDWIDLSTGINRQPYPLPELQARLWQDLPRASDTGALIAAAGRLYGLPADQILPLAGAQAAIQLYPRLSKASHAKVLGPTYNEHAAALTAQGWKVTVVTDLAALEGADLALVVNPNNPGGQHWQQSDLMRLAGRVGRLIVDESFADPVPDISLAAQAGKSGLVVLRSIGKFWGLAGLRLGFVLADQKDIAHLAALSGPWAVSGPACAIGKAALSDLDWQSATTARLAGEAQRHDALASGAGWQLAGGTHLFRTYLAPVAADAQDKLARAWIWTRIFPYSAQMIRLGLPGNPLEWDRLAAALAP